MACSKRCDKTKIVIAKWPFMSSCAPHPEYAALLDG
jgi:hypothetical protein